MNKKPIIPIQIWEILYPMLLYYAVTVIVMFAAKSVFGAEEEKYMLCQIMVGIFTLPVMLVSFYLPDRKAYSTVYGANAPETKKGWICMLAAAAGIALVIGTGINNLILMSPLTEASAGFSEANSNFYAAGLITELIASGFFTPILEEVTFRAIIYDRLRRMYGAKAAVLVSALTFAVLHFNLVQFVYALIMGIVFGLLLEKGGSLLVPITGHMAVNCLAILRTELDWLAGTCDGSAFAWGSSLLITAAGIVFLVFYLQRAGRKQEQF